MAVKIENIENSTIIRITHSGKVSLDQRVNVVHQICVDHHNDSTLLKLLIDARLVTNVMTEAEQDVFGSYIASRPELEKAFVAVIANPKQVLNQIVLKKSSLLGHNIMLFEIEAEALEWLNNASSELL